MGTSDKSSSRDDQKTKAPENSKMKTGKMKLVPEVVIERRVPRREVAKEPPRERDSEVGNESDEEGEAEVSKTGVGKRERRVEQESVPEWRRNAPKQVLRRPEGQELPFKDVPAVVSVPSEQMKPAPKKQVQFDGTEPEGPSFKRKAPVEEKIMAEH